jgi:hypothetical protein
MTCRVLLPVLVCCIAAGPATKPLFPGATTKPATQPTSAPARVRDGLLGGSVRFLVPSQWRLFDRKEDQTQVFYHPSPEVGTVSVMVTPQGSVIPAKDQATRDRIAKTLLGLINKDLATRSVQVVNPPKLESDERFFIKIHERYTDGDYLLDVVHMYRVVGFNLVSVRVSFQNDAKDEERAKAVHEAGALVLMSVTTGAKDAKIVREIK